MDPGRLLLLLVVILLVAVPSVYRRMKEERDPEWERRWAQLPLAERWRLSRRAQQGIAPADPIEAELLSGSARCQRSVMRAALPRTVVWLLVASVAILAAVAEGSAVMIGLGLGLLAFVLWRGHRNRAVYRRLARVEDPDVGLETERYRP